MVYMCVNLKQGRGWKQELMVKIFFQNPKQFLVYYIIDCLANLKLLNIIKYSRSQKNK